MAQTAPGELQEQRVQTAATAPQADREAQVGPVAQARLPPMGMILPLRPQRAAPAGLAEVVALAGLVRFIRVHPQPIPVMAETGAELRGVARVVQLQRMLQPMKPTARVP